MLEGLVPEVPYRSCIVKVLVAQLQTILVVKGEGVLALQAPGLVIIGDCKGALRLQPIIDSFL